MINTDLANLQAKLKYEESPEILSIVCDGNKVDIDLYIREDISWFKGHFPEQAVLPGVVQVHWVGIISKILFPTLVKFKTINNLKYKSMILPNFTVKLSIEYIEEKQKIKFTYKNDEGLLSTGNLDF